MNNNNVYKFFTIVILIFFLYNCSKKEEIYTPKPKGYYRIELPAHQYCILDTSLPFTCQYSQLATYTFSQKENGDYWIYFRYPTINAEINVTYSILSRDLRERTMEEDKIVSFHYQVADNVEYSIISAPNAKIYGQLYDIEGVTVASPLSFWVTDSIKHFLRGSLYFNNPPNNDSLQPVIQYVREDILQMINTLEWRK